jgi:hypothetical protein
MTRNYLVALVLMSLSCARWAAEPKAAPETVALVVLIVDEQTGMNLPGTHTSVRPSEAPFRAEGPFLLTDSMGVVKVEGLRPGRYAVHAKRIGFAQKDTVVTVTATSPPARIPLSRAPLYLQ